MPDKRIHSGRIAGGALALVLALAACDGGDGGGDASLPAPVNEGAVAVMGGPAAPEPAPPAAADRFAAAPAAGPATAADRFAAAAAAGKVVEQLAKKRQSGIYPIKRNPNEITRKTLVMYLTIL